MNNKYVKTEREGLVKDMTSGALLNVDSAALDAYRAKKKKNALEASNAARLTQVEAKLDRLTDLLEQLVRKSE